MVTFIYPYSFLLLIFLILFFLGKKKRFQVNEKIIVNKHISNLKKLFLGLGYIFLVIALARPVTDKKEINTNNNIKKVTLALDISKSMLAEDNYPNRLEFAKNKIGQFIDNFQGEIAILAFSDSAFLISPYTTDKTTLKYLLKNIDTEYITSSGTDFKNLLTTAKKMGFKDLVVFSDGGEIKKLDTDGVNFYALLVGTKKGAPIKLKSGNLLTSNGKVVIVKRNDSLLKWTKFGVIASNSDSDIKQLISQNFQTIKNKKTITVYKELFIYPLSFGLLFLLLSFFSLPKRNEKLIAMVSLFFIFFNPINLNAGLLDWYYIQQGEKSYKKGEFQQAIQNYKKISSRK